MDALAILRSIRALCIGLRDNNRTAIEAESVNLFIVSAIAPDEFFLVLADLDFEIEYRESHARILGDADHGKRS